MEPPRPGLAPGSGRPPYDPVLMFRILVLQTLYTLSGEQAEYQLRDRRSFMRFAGLALHDAVPDAKTIWLFRERLVRAGAFERLFDRFDAALARARLYRHGRADSGRDHRGGPPPAPDAGREGRREGRRRPRGLEARPHPPDRPRRPLDAEARPEEAGPARRRGPRGGARRSR